MVAFFLLFPTVSFPVSATTSNGHVCVPCVSFTGFFHLALFMGKCDRHESHSWSAEQSEQLSGYPGCHHQIQRTKHAGASSTTPCPKISAALISSAVFFAVLPFYVCPQSPVTWQRVVLICCLCPRRPSPQDRGSSEESVQGSYVVCEFVVME